MGIERKEMFEGLAPNWSRMPIRNIAAELLEIFCELVASAEKMLNDPEAAKFFIRLASKMDANLLAWLFEKRFPLRPFINSIDPKRIFPGASGPSHRHPAGPHPLHRHAAGSHPSHRHPGSVSEPGSTPGSTTLRKRWRLLKKRLNSVADAACNVLPAQSHICSDNSAPDRSANRAFDTTLADLRPLVSFHGRVEGVKAAWRIHGRAVTARVAASPDAFSPVIKHLYWEGAGRRKIAFWERLVHCQAGELTEIRRFAHEVSRRTGRVVLSWHNASLGAAGGWAFDDLAAPFESPALYSSFVREVLKDTARIRESFDLASAMELCSMRVERLFAPKLARAVENRSIAAEGFLRGFKETELPGTGESDTANRAKHEWPGALAPHQQISRGQVLAWIESTRKSWADGLSLLFALANQGQRMLDAGVIDSLVLPWIDKFFISSRRQADIAYLGGLFRFVSANIQSPLVLFWDDTPHARAPSLGLALDRMAGEGLPFRGLGIFNAGISEGHAAERGEAAKIIAGQYPQKALFALRPINENHCPGTFRRIFEDLDESFFLNYDSSWKDNLAFLYAGTQVFPLLGTQTEMESVSPWIVLQGKRYAFGAWFRRILRRVSLGKSREPSGHLHRAYCSWANLL